MTQATLRNEAPEAICTHWRRAAALDMQILEAERLVHQIRLSLPSELGGRPQPRLVTLYWWKNAWASDPLLAVSFGGETVYARGLRIPEDRLSQISEGLTRHPEAVIDDKDGQFRGQRPEVLGWAARAAAPGQVAVRGLPVDAAPINCSPEIGKLWNEQITRMRDDTALMRQCECRQPDSSTTDLADSTSGELPEPQKSPQAEWLDGVLERHRKSPWHRVNRLIDRSLRNLALTSKVFVFGLIDRIPGENRPQHRERAYELSQILDNPYLSAAERDAYEAEYLAEVFKYTDIDLAAELEDDLRSHREEIASLRQRLNRNRERFGYLKAVSAGAAGLSVASLLPMTAGAPIYMVPISLISSGLMIRALFSHLRNRRAKAAQAYLLAIKASERGDLKEVGQRLVEGRTAMTDL